MKKKKQTDFVTEELSLFISIVIGPHGIPDTEDMPEKMGQIQCGVAVPHRASLSKANATEIHQSRTHIHTCQTFVCITTKAA